MISGEMTYADVLISLMAGTYDIVFASKLITKLMNDEYQRGYGLGLKAGEEAALTNVEGAFKKLIREYRDAGSSGSRDVADPPSPGSQRERLVAGSGTPDQHESQDEVRGFPD